GAAVRAQGQRDDQAVSSEPRRLRRGGGGGRRGDPHAAPRPRGPRSPEEPRGRGGQGPRPLRRALRHRRLTPPPSGHSPSQRRIWSPTFSISSCPAGSVGRPTGPAGGPPGPV